MKVKLKRKQKEQKKCVVKKEIKHEDYLNCYKNDTYLYKTQLRFNSRHHEVYTIKINKIALSVNDDKRLQVHDGITFAHGTNVGIVCKAELLTKTI